MTNQSTSTPSPSPDDGPSPAAAADSSPQVRRLLNEVGRWAAEHGVPLPIKALPALSQVLAEHLDAPAEFRPASMPVGRTLDPVQLASVLSEPATWATNGDVRVSPTHARLAARALTTQADLLASIRFMCAGGSSDEQNVVAMIDYASAQSGLEVRKIPITIDGEAPADHQADQTIRSLAKARDLSRLLDEEAKSSREFLDRPSHEGKQLEVFQRLGNAVRGMREAADLLAELSRAK